MAGSSVESEILVSLLARLFGGDGIRAGVPGPMDDYWYKSAGAGIITAAGTRVDDQSAQMVSAWYRGRDILATILAMLPLPTLERLPDDGGSRVARNHPLYDVLHDMPNDTQDSFQWRRQLMFDIIDHGWAFCFIVAGPRGFADQLVRIDPTLVTPKQQIVTLPNGARVRGRYLFDVRDPKGGPTQTFTQDEIFYLRGAGGKGILDYARTSLGTALATESYAAKIFGRGTLNGGVIEVPAVLDPEAGKNMAKSFLTAAGDWHMPKVLEQGAKWVQNELTPEDAQMLLSRKFSIDDMARWLGVPRQMLENSDPSFGNAEQFDQNFITYSMGGWLSLWEFGINHQLILNPARFYVQFTRNAFVRGKFSERIAGLVLAAGGPIMTRNEARKVEDYNTINEPAYDKLIEQQNITGKPSASAPSNAPAAPPQRSAGTKAQAIAVESAARLLRKEVAAVQKMAVRHAADGDAFAAAVTEFYAAHAELVAATLLLERSEADGYCSQQAAQIINGDWLSALETWKTQDYAAGLAGLALDEAA